MYLVLLSYMRPRLDIWVAYFALFGSKGALAEGGSQMNELKWNWVYCLYLDPPENQKESAQQAGYVKVVSKSEADKVIADLIEKNERLARKDIIMASEAIKDVYKELYHNKYRRCLDKAKWCFFWKNYWHCCEPTDSGAFIARERFFSKWEKRWLKIAEEFKEACK